MTAIDCTPAGWAANLGVIKSLQAENELLQLKLADALAQLALYRIELRNADAIRNQLMAELVDLRFAPASRQPAVVIPIRETMA